MSADAPAGRVAGTEGVPYLPIVETRRALALDLAVKALPGPASHTADRARLVDVAREFEQYIEGGPETDPDPWTVQAYLNLVAIVEGRSVDGGRTALTLFLQQAPADVKQAAQEVIAATAGTEAVDLR